MAENNPAELNIYQKLAKIRKRVEVVQKDKSGYGYKYVSEAEILAKITGAMDSLGVSLIPGTVHGSFEVTPYSYVKNKKGIEETVNEIIVKGDTVFRWVNNDNPEEYIEVPWELFGQQSDASQAFGSGLTYCTRYFLLKYFGVATPEDDPDNWRTKQKEAEEAEDKALAASLMNEFDIVLRTFVAEHPEKREDVIKIVSKYEKTKNYLKIQNSTIAKKLIEEYNKFVKENT